MESVLLERKHVSFVYNLVSGVLIHAISGCMFMWMNEYKKKTRMYFVHI